MILILSNKSDIHCNPVISKLNKLKVNYFRLNTDCLAKDYIISFKTVNNNFELIIQNRINNKIIYFDDVTAIWERRPTCVNLEHVTDKNYLQVMRDEFDELRWWIRTFKFCGRHLGHSLNDRLNENKLYQLKIAKNIIDSSTASKISVPNTIITNDSFEIVDFVKQFDVEQYFTIKPIYADGLLVGKEEEIVFWSKRISSKQILDALESRLLSTPIFLQTYIPKSQELRVTMVGEKIFTCAIDSQSSKNELGKDDWRQLTYQGIPLKQIKTPNEIREFCIRYSNLINTNFGCFDFIETRSGDYFFLECNPNGQWMWLEEECNVPISDAIVDFLIS